jgi:hypothetical protein
MAGRNEGCASIGCLGLILLALIGMCTSPEPDRGAGGGYSGDTYTPPVTAPTTGAAAERQEWFYIHGPMNVRSAPNQDASLVRKLRRGDMVQLGPRDANGWARIYTGAAGDEYIYRDSNQVRSDPPAAPEPLVTSGSGSSGRARRPGGGRQLHVGPRGGCYYINSNGNKTYVDRSECH